MELRHLRYFVAVADHGSFSEASRRLYVAQSAISEQIADLEGELGGPLFTRNSRRLVLTPQGRLFLAEARKILSSSSQAVSIFQRAMAGDIGTLSIGFFAWGVGPYFAKIIREFRTLHPGVQLELHEMLSREQLECLGTGKIDVGFGRPVEPPFDKVYASETLYSERLMVVLPANHALSGKPVRVEELANERFIMRDRKGIGHRYDEILNVCTKAGFEADIVSSARSWSGVLSLVEAGVGVALAPCGIRRIAAEGLSIEPLTPETVDVGIALIWNPGNDSPRLKSFLEIVRKYAGEIADWSRQ